MLFLLELQYSYDIDFLYSEKDIVSVQPVAEVAMQAEQSEALNIVKRRNASTDSILPSYGFSKQFISCEYLPCAAA